jgi:hypothetical protein
VKSEEVKVKVKKNKVVKRKKTVSKKQGYSEGGEEGKAGSFGDS